MFDVQFKVTDDGLNLLYAWFPSMHTRVDLIIQSTLTKNKLMAVVGEIQQLLYALEQIGNKFNPSSELSILNDRASQEYVSVSRILFDMLSICKTYNKYTNGYFDVCAVADCSDHEISVSAMQLNEEDHSVFFSKPGIRIDLSGFIKGYALDLIKELLIGENIDNALISLGTSSILSIGDGPSGKGWEVSLPGNDHITLSDSFLSTSGNETAERMHIINPHTGKYILGEGWVSVETVSGYVGEIVSTALFSTPIGEERNELLASLKNNPNVSKWIKNVQIK